ncbi:MAG: CcmD family protein [Polyangiaceae bacterium]|nr:CcmD family protein [Polyangiaceae bacterium]
MQSAAAHGISVEDRRDQFVPVQGGTERASATQLLVIAYVLMWLLALLFVYVTWRRQGALDRRLSELEKALTARTEREKASES